MEIEGQTNVLNDSRTIKINFDPRVPINELKTILEEIGSVVRFYTFSTESKSIALITFNSAYEARKALRMGYIRTSKIMVEKSTQTDLIDETLPKLQVRSQTFPSRASMPIRPEQRPEPHIAPYENLVTAHPYSPVPCLRPAESTFLGSPVPNLMTPTSYITHYVDETNTRLFCQIPRSGPINEREDKFILHFSKFGQLIYHQVLTDKFGQPNVGFVCYLNPNDAGEALLFSAPMYKARPAEPRKMSILDFGKPASERQVYHTCGMLIERSIFSLHENTCRKLQQLQCQAATTIIGKPVLYEKAAKRPKSPESVGLDSSAKKIKSKVDVDLTEDKILNQLISMNQMFMKKE